LIIRDIKAQVLSGNTTTSIADVDQKAIAVIIQDGQRYRFYPTAGDTTVFTVHRAGGTGLTKIITEIPAQIGIQVGLGSATKTIHVAFGTE